MSETFRFVGVALAAMVLFRFVSELGLIGLDADKGGKATVSQVQSKNATASTPTVGKLGKNQVHIQYCTS